MRTLLWCRVCLLEHAPTSVVRVCVIVWRACVRAGACVGACCAVRCVCRYLAEHELISLMERHGIGTDASMASHISNVQARNYVRLESGRTLVPTELGIVLVHGYLKIDPDLVLPKVGGWWWRRWWWW